ncbi:hypothetical protein GCM10023187_07570 [Nibrella viscosa]|uniref:Uncharacterized protein n=1 Tax=Nibrella viscosa TaxID=1084524 RepID=A0ABP8JY24_9BACT
MMITAAPDALSGAGLKYSSVGLVMPFNKPVPAPDSFISDAFELGTSAVYKGMISWALAPIDEAHNQAANAATVVTFLPSLIE